MSEEDTEVSDESEMDRSDYTKNDSMYRLLTDDHIRRVLAKLGAGNNPDHIEMVDGVHQLLVDLGVLFENETEQSFEQRYILNQHNELVKILQTPHINRILSNKAAVAVLSVHIRKLYLPCIPVDILVDFTGHSEEEVEEAVSLLKKFNILRGSMVIDGKHEKESVLQDADELIERVDAIVDLLEDEERDEIPREELETAVGDLANGEREEDVMLVMKEDEFHTRVREAAEIGVEHIRTTDTLATLDAGTTGTKLDLNNDLAKLFGRLHTSLVTATNDIFELTEES